MSRCRVWWAPGRRGRVQRGGKCDTCRNTWDLQAQRELVRQALEARLMTQSEIVSALTVMGIPRGIKTVNSWVRRGRLPEVSPRLYRFATALDLAQQTPARDTPAHQLTTSNLAE